MVLLSSCTAASTASPTASSSTTTVGSSGPSSSAGSEPSAPALDDELAVRLVQIGDVTWIYPVAQVTVMADGRIVMPPTADELTWRERRLSPRGVDMVVQAVRDTGLFGASANYPMEHRPGAPEWPGMGGSLITVTLGDDAAQVVVSGGVWFGDEFEATYNVASPERKALSTLATRLADLSWLPDDAWLDPESQRYEPAASLLITSWVLGDNPRQPNIEDIAWPFDEPLIEFGTVLRQSSDEMMRCGIVQAAQAQAIIERLRSVPGSGGSGPEFYASLRSPDAAIELWLEPMLPDGFPGCGALLVGGA
jgi:hypothetical protein